LAGVEQTREGLQKIASAKIAETATAHRALDQIKGKDRGVRNSGFLQQCSAAVEKPNGQQRTSLFKGGGRGIHSIKGILQPFVRSWIGWLSDIRQCQCVAQQLSSNKADREGRLRAARNRSIVPGMKTEKATFGAGCFWGVEETFRKLKGVVSTAVGYAGGTKDNPSYEDVCTDETGHAEVVEVEFDRSQISYTQLLDVFWSNHNPTMLNRQGPDVGSQYRSVIFHHSPEQKAAAEFSKDELEKSRRFNRPIVTQIEPAPRFWRAEEYHQRYLEKRGQSHCAI
jgi:peptide-methionine (S)-S-oxide reductase